MKILLLLRVELNNWQINLRSHVNIYKFISVFSILQEKAFVFATKYNVLLISPM